LEILLDKKQKEKSQILEHQITQVYSKQMKKSIKNMMKIKMLTYLSRFITQLKMKHGIEEWKQANQNEFGLSFIKYLIRQTLLFR